MPFDSRAYEASRRTLTVHPETRAVLADGTPVRVVCKTVTQPGYFVDGRLESWEVKTLPRRTLLGTTSTVLGHGATRSEAMDAAERSPYNPLR